MTSIQNPRSIELFCQISDFYNSFFFERNFFDSFLFCWRCDWRKIWSLFSRNLLSSFIKKLRPEKSIQRWVFSLIEIQVSSFYKICSKILILFFRSKNKIILFICNKKSCNRDFFVTWLLICFNFKQIELDWTIFMRELTDRLKTWNPGLKLIGFRPGFYKMRSQQI